ncbi:uncharacterized protein LOC124202411 isoform X2 [Daphnia pulex]|uniref:uncharacterized protein LOC124202411 isoform X2 n=1 Tax=Daphnia pulex TaxID=6669 RepID=UPI001EE0B491|nr:uncharacterized protein LOC124202411 isoform X2 [Daphnia pulex]
MYWLSLDSWSCESCVFLRRVCVKVMYQGRPKADWNLSDSITYCTSRLDVPMDLRPMSVTTQSYRYVTTAVGTLINLLVIVVVCRSRQLHYPRHVFWAAISVMNQFQIIHFILEVVAIAGRNRVACQICVLNAGVLHTIILTLLALAGLDRYLAIARYEWYKEKVTNRGTILLLSIGFVVTYLTFTSPFWTGYKKIKNCTINLTHMHVVLIYDLFMGILCVILHIMIFFLSRAAIKKQPLHFRQNPIALKFLQTPLSNVGSEPADVEIEVPALQAVTAPDATGNVLPPHFDSQLDDTLCFTWFLNRPKLNRLEIRAAFSMSVNILPFWLCTFPVTVNGIIIYWCIHLQMNCPTVYRINPYIYDLFIVHVIYNPLMYISTSKEFKRALIHFKQKFRCKKRAQ